MKKLYVFGNEFLEEDKLAGFVSNNFKNKFEIINCRSPDELLEVQDEKILILDVVKGIKEPIIIDDLNQIKNKNMISLHDFDLGFFLNLLEGMGISKNIKIIGIPQKGSIASITKKVEAII